MPNTYILHWYYPLFWNVRMTLLDIPYQENLHLIYLWACLQCYQHTCGHSSICTRRIINRKYPLPVPCTHLVPPVCAVQVLDYTVRLHASPTMPSRIIEHVKSPRKYNRLRLLRLQAKLDRPLKHTREFMNYTTLLLRNISQIEKHMTLITLCVVDPHARLCSKATRPPTMKYLTPCSTNTCNYRTVCSNSIFKLPTRIPIPQCS